MTDFRIETKSCLETYAERAAYIENCERAMVEDRARFDAQTNQHERTSTEINNVLSEAIEVFNAPMCDLIADIRRTMRRGA